MKRNTNLEEFLFPIELRDIYYSPNRPGQPQLDKGNSRPPQKRIPGYRAVVNCETDKPISLVTDGYRLVSNREALALAEQCFKKLYNTETAVQMETFNIIAPATKSFCHVDLIHKGYNVNIWNQEVWIPYMRVTNSYNRTRALRFDLGFCRKLCTNGVIFERETITHRFYHTKQQIAPQGEFIIEFGKLKRFEAEFTEYMGKLRDCQVPDRFVFPMVCKALSLNFDLDTTDPKKLARERDRFQELKEGVENRRSRYYSELGPNAYAVLNIVSDIASDPFIFKARSVMVDNLQKRVGNWIGEFSEAIQSSEFQFIKYLRDYANLLI